jgi:flagellar basal body-associated protein FliL
MRDNMTNNIEDIKPNNRKLWIILAGIFITVIGITLAFFGMTSSANKNQDNPASPQNQSSSAAASSLTVPTIESVKTDAEAKKLSFSITVKNANLTNAFIEYEVTDQDRVVRDSGKERTANFTATVPVSSSAYYRMKVRVANDEGKKTEWSENYTVKLSELEGMKTVEPLQEYYETGWAKGTDTSLEAAKTAIETAWNITEIKRQEAVTECLPINTGEMKPKLLLPPIPSVLPSQVRLNYMVNDWNGSAISITYLWCQ